MSLFSAQLVGIKIQFWRSSELLTAQMHTLNDEVTSNHVDSWSRITQMNSIALVSVCVMFLSSLLGFSRALLPSRIHEAFGNEVWPSYVFAYTVVMGLIGWMLCYLYDDPSNTRRNTVFVVAARAIASVLIWFSLSHNRAGILLISVLWIAHLQPLLATPRRTQKKVTYPTKKINARQMNGAKSSRIHKRTSFQAYNGSVSEVPLSKWCTLCKSGSIVNRRTNCNIRIGGGTFQHLVEEGATPDFQHGYIWLAYFLLSSIWVN